MEIQILSLGKFRSSIPFKDIFNFYKNRISFDLNLVELKTFDTEKSRKLKLEKNEITKHLKKEDCVVILDKAGKHISSEEFSKFLDLKMKNRIKRVCFIIGSEIGMDDSIKKGENIFTYGKQTCTQLIVRMMLIEQKYITLEI